MCILYIVQCRTASIEEWGCLIAIIVLKIRSMEGRSMANQKYHIQGYEQLGGFQAYKHASLGMSWQCEDIPVCSDVKSNKGFHRIGHGAAAVMI